MTVLNGLDRFHLVLSQLNWVPSLKTAHAKLNQFMEEELARHWRYVREDGQDMPKIHEWQWRGWRDGRCLKYRLDRFGSRTFMVT